MADLIFQGVHKRYGSSPDVIRDVNLTIRQGEFCVFVGPSGCGKSTLLRMVAGLEEISGGELLLDGRRINETPPGGRGMAMVFQSYALYPHMTVYQNMAFGLKVGKVDGDTIERKVREAARMLQLEPLLERLPKALSGGQRQRVAIGRAIVRQPQIFLFDEPLSNLDAELRVQTRLEIARLHAQISTSSMIYVTHDQVEAMTLADQIVLLNAGAAVQSEGSVAQSGAPLELYHYPRNKFVAGFIGSPKMNFVGARLRQATPRLATVLVGATVLELRVDATALAPDSALELGIRPEHACLVDTSAPGNVLPGSVAYVEQLGDASYVYVRLADGADLTVRASGAVPRLGDRVGVLLAPECMHAFGANGQACRRSVDLPTAGQARFRDGMRV